MHPCTLKKISLYTERQYHAILCLREIVWDCYSPIYFYRNSGGSDLDQTCRGEVYYPMLFYRLRSSKVIGCLLDEMFRQSKQPVSLALLANGKWIQFEVRK